VGAVIVIGDETSCAGYRLAGAEVRSPAPGEVADSFAAALQSAQLVLLTRSAAAALAPSVLMPALARETPLVLVLPDITALHEHPDTARRIRAVLGIDA
jgi:vacuolar-type H+-ATPase subunit F/Vma7